MWEEPTRLVVVLDMKHRHNHPIMYAASLPFFRSTKVQHHNFQTSRDTQSRPWPTHPCPRLPKHRPRILGTSSTTTPSSPTIVRKPSQPTTSTTPRSTCESEDGRTRRRRKRAQGVENGLETSDPYGSDVSEGLSATRRNWFLHPRPQKGGFVADMTAACDTSSPAMRVRYLRSMRSLRARGGISRFAAAVRTKHRFAFSPNTITRNGGHPGSFEPVQAGVWTQIDDRVCQLFSTNRSYV
jgi:hypothetical protein